MRKSNSTGAAKWFRPSIFAPFAEAGRRHSKEKHLPNKNVG